MWKFSLDALALRENHRIKTNATHAEKGIRPILDYELDLAIFNALPRGHVIKHEFLLSCQLQQNPDIFEYEKSGVQNYWMLRMAMAVCAFRHVVVMGCASCVSGSTRIFDPVSGEHPQIGELYRKNIRPTVLTAIGPRLASVPFVKGESELLEIECEDGSSFRCTPEHRVLTPSGYVRADGLRIGQLLLGCDASLLPSTSEHARSVQREDDRSFLRTIPNSMDCCSPGSRPCDELLLRGLNISRSFFPSPSDVRKYTACASLRWGVRDTSQLCTRPYLSSTPFETRTPSDLILSSEIPGQFRCVSGKRERAFLASRFLAQFHSDTHLHLPSESPFLGELHSERLCNSESQERNEESFSSFPEWVSQKRVSAIRKSHRELFYDMTVPDAHHYLAEGVIHHNSGKTYYLSSAAYTFWKADPRDTACYVSTTSAEAGEARTWGAIKDFFNKDQFQVGVLLSSQRMITLDDETKNEAGEKERDMRHGVKAVLVKSGNEGQNIVGTICGRKSGAVIWQCDEMAFMDMGILEARVNLFSNMSAAFWGLCNAPKEGSPAYMDAEPYGEKYPDGWRSVNKDRDKFWPLKTGGICLYFNGDESPNMKVSVNVPVPFPRLMDRAKKEEIRKMAGGEDNPVFWTQFYGFPPAVDVPDKVVTHKLLEENGAFKPAEWVGQKWKVGAGLDLGFREDGDPCILDFFKIGMDVRGRTIAEFEPDGITLTPSQVSKDSFETQIGKQVVAACRRRDCHDLALDVSGDGGVLLQAIEKQARAENYTLNVTPVSFSGAADSTIVVPGETRTGTEMFDRKVSQLWMMFRISVVNGVVRGCREHTNAIEQLCARKYGTDDKKRFTVEKKSDMKKRIRRSPDHGDARCVGLYLAVRMGLSGQPAQKPKPLPQVPQEQKPVQYSRHSQGAQYSRR